MATHSRILAWRIPWTEEPGGLQSMGSQSVGQDQLTSATNPCTFFLSLLNKINQFQQREILVFLICLFLLERQIVCFPMHNRFIYNNLLMEIIPGEI